MSESEGNSPPSDQDGFTTRELQRIDSLREEAWNVKLSFSNYTFQVLAFAGIVLGLIAKFIDDTPYFGLVSIPIVILLLTVAKIGTHMYATSNRIYGYILHLERIAHFTDERSRVLRTMGWEEAMKAWRVVQSATFDNLYENGPRRWFRFLKKKNTLRRVHTETDRIHAYRWYEPQALCENLRGIGKVSTSWHPGDYLSNMLFVLHLTAWLALLPLIFSIIKTIELEKVSSFREVLALPALWLYALTFVATSVYTLYHIRRINARRKVLEEGLLCIHSCAVMWHAVTVANHGSMVALSRHRAAENPQGILDDSVSYRFLTACLSYLASDLNGLRPGQRGPREIERIHDWIDTSDDEFADKLHDVIDALREKFMDRDYRVGTGVVQQ